MADFRTIKYHKAKEKDLMSFYAREANAMGISYGKYMATVPEKERKEKFARFCNVGYDEALDNKIKEEEIDDLVLYEMTQHAKMCADEYVDRLLQAMKKKGMNTVVLSLRTGINDRTIRTYKTGVIPKKKNLILICNVLEVTPEWLLTGA